MNKSGGWGRGIALLVAAVGGVLGVGGCCTAAPTAGGEEIPAPGWVLTVTAAPEGAEGGWLVHGVLYDERDGALLSAPKQLLREGTPGRMEMVRPATGNFTVASRALGTLNCKAAAGLQTWIAVKSAPGAKALTVDAFLLYQEWSRDRMAVRMLDVPAVRIEPGQPVLLLRRGDGVIRIPVDRKSAEKMAELRRFSPHFPADRL